MIGKMAIRDTHAHRSYWNGSGFKEENDQDGGLRLSSQPDFSEGEGQWWHNRIGTIMHLRKRANVHISRSP